MPASPSRVGKWKADNESCTITVHGKNANVNVLVSQLCPTLCDPMDRSPPGSSVQGDSPGKSTEVGLPCPPTGDLPNPETEPRSPLLQPHSLLFESQRSLHFMEGESQLVQHYLFIWSEGNVEAWAVLELLGSRSDSSL